MTDKAALVIYDADPDGFGSAYAAWCRLGDHADYVEVGHGTDEIPQIAYDGYDIVYIFDLSFPEEELAWLRAETNVVVIDHHESAREMLENFGYTVDTSRAACVQVWEHFYKDQPAPMILQYVADRDIWKWELEHSDEINNIIFLTDKTFTAWEDLSWNLSNQFWTVLEAGRYLVQYREKLVDLIVKYHTLQPMLIEPDVPSIPVVCSPILHSEVGHRLLDMYPDAPYVATYVDEPGGIRKYSLRSENHRYDVGKIAKEFGGGGHRNAAGYRAKRTLVGD